ncbi:MAG: hypothetical protein HOP18_09785 [Deltaproteobacteria bacterium]|nr:hypothetical protein [Deltaproteobacteria bacterium]
MKRGRCWLWVVVFVLIGRASAEARLASQLSLSVGEEYTDNVFFSAQKQHDLITVVTPTLSLIYQPSATSGSRFTVDINAPAEIFARHSELNNIGDRLSLRARFSYPYSRRLSFEFTECLGRLGQARNGGIGDVRRDEGSGSGGGSGSSGGFGGGRGQGQSGGCGGGGGFGGGESGSSQSLGNEGELVTSGELLENNFEASGRFLTTPNLSLRGMYEWRYVSFIDTGGRETSHAGEFEATYSRWRQHNLRARYRIEFLKSRNGETDMIHDVDIGDDFLSTQQIRLTPTLTLSASTGISLATGGGKFRLGNKSDVRLFKLWQTAAFEIGMRRGLTGSFGVGGPSFTTSFFSHFTISLTRRLNAFVAADYSMFDTDEEDFNTFIAGAGFSYNIFYWLSANLAYSYRRATPEGNSLSSTSSLQGKSNSNTVFLMFSAAFDLWPNLGLGRHLNQSLPLSSSPSETP